MVCRRRDRHPDQRILVDEPDRHGGVVDGPHPQRLGERDGPEAPVPAQVARMQLDRKSFLLPRGQVLHEGAEPVRCRRREFGAHAAIQAEARRSRTPISGQSEGPAPRAGPCLMGVWAVRPRRAPARPPGPATTSASSSSRRMRVSAATRPRAAKTAPTWNADENPSTSACGSGRAAEDGVLGLRRRDRGQRRDAERAADLLRGVDQARCQPGLGRRSRRPAPRSRSARRRTRCRRR